VTDPVGIGLGVAILVVAAITGREFVPSAITLDAERWFKLMFATLLRGAAEAAGRDAAAWEAEVVRFVPYNPLGREPERKVARGALPDGQALPGERLLADTIAAMPPGKPRWERLYDTDEPALEARLADPTELGADYDPATRLGPDAGWDALAAWTPAFTTALERRFPARWALIPGGDPVDVLGALKAVLGDRATVVPAADPEPLALAIGACAPSSADRLVIAVGGTALLPVLKALHASAGLRDRVLAVISVGGVVLDGTEATADWIGAHFRPEDLDTEIDRPTVYAAIQWLDRAIDPPGIEGVPLEAMRFPKVPERPTVSRIDVVDLGPLPLDPLLPVQAVARAIVAWTAGYVLSRG
jgi:hypothetical protein